MLKNLLKAAVGTALLPVDLLYDAATGFGIVTDDDPAVYRRGKDIARNLKRAVDPDEDCYDDWF